MTKINQQIAGSRIASVLDSEGNRSLSLDTVSAVANLEALIQAAESASELRTSWGSNLRKFPFSLAPVRTLFLRVLGLLFRDQRRVNSALVDVLQASLELQVRLCEQVDAMRIRIEALEVAGKKSGARGTRSKS